MTFEELVVDTKQLKDKSKIGYDLTGDTVKLLKLRGDLSYLENAFKKVKVKELHIYEPNCERTAELINKIFKECKIDSIKYKKI